MARKITSPVVIATHNPGKLAEMRDLLAPFGVAAQSASELGLDEPQEKGKTLADNARDRVRCPRLSPTIPAWWSMRSTATPAFIPRAGPGRTKTSASP